MKNNFGIFCVSSLLASAICFNAKADDIVTNTARMQAMDKITGRVSVIDVPVNGLANFGTFSILVRKCVTKSPEETPENTAFVDVVDNYKTDEPVNIFKGWMFSSTPALNAVEHPIYDVWLLKCYNSRNSAANILTEEQLSLRDSIPMVRHEKIEQHIDLAIVDKAKEDIVDETTDQTETISEEVVVEEVMNNISDTVSSAAEEFASEGEEFVGDLVEEHTTNAETENLANQEESSEETSLESD